MNSNGSPRWRRAVSALLGVLIALVCFGLFDTKTGREGAVSRVSARIDSVDAHLRRVEMESVAERARIHQRIDVLQSGVRELLRRYPVPSGGRR